MVDEVWTSVGSTNFDNRSFRLNDEANLNILDAGLAAGQATVFEADKARARRITFDDWRRAPPPGAGRRVARGPAAAPALGESMSFLRRWWAGVWSSLWFIPGLIVVGSAGAAVLLVEMTLPFGDAALRWPRLLGAGAEGSRGMLTAVATSMITVAGVVFSITIVVLSLASSQYTSRVLRSFMIDRANQAVLGVFVGIFAYCLVVLRTIRSGDEGVFVPSLAVLGGVVLAFVGIGFLVYFIHHIATAIQASSILAAVAEDTLRAVDRMFAEQVGGAANDEAASAREQDARVRHRLPVPAGRSGYIQLVDDKVLLEVAHRGDTVVRMERSVGEFVIEGAVLAVIEVEEAGTAREDIGRLAGAFTIDRQRSVDHDPAYGIRQIVDVALKALSPGINDSTTAVMCVDYLTAILSRVACRHIPSPLRTRDGVLRVIARGPSFGTLMDEAFDQIRQHGGGNVAVLGRLIWAYRSLSELSIGPAQRRLLLDHVAALREAIQRTVPSPTERRELEADLDELTLRLVEPA